MDITSITAIIGRHFNFDRPRSSARASKIIIANDNTGNINDKFRSVYMRFPLYDINIYRA